MCLQGLLQRSLGKIRAEYRFSSAWQAERCNGFTVWQAVEKVAILFFQQNQVPVEEAPVEGIEEGLNLLCIVYRFADMGTGGLLPYAA